MFIGLVFSFYWFYLNNKKLQMKMTKAAFVFAPPFLLLWGFISTMYFLPFIEAFGNASKMPGLRLYGSLFFDWIAVLLVAKLFRIDLKKLFDVWTISMVAYLAVGRVNCLVTGCCYGTPFLGTEWRWPIREIEIIANIGFLIFFIPRVLRNKTNGELYPLFLVYYGAIRFVLEWFRVEGYPIGPFHLAHLWSILSIITGYSIYATIVSKNKLPERERKGRKST